jgi:hypothetical protein
MNQFEYTPAEDGTSFTIKSNFDGDKPSTKTFALRDMTNWQLGKMNLFVSALLKESEGIGSVIVTSLLSLFGEGNSDDVKKVLSGFKDLTKGNNFVTGLTTGVGSILGYFGKDDNMARLAAILFLAEGEESLSDEEFTKRVALFNRMPAKQTWRAAMGFFASKLDSLTNLPSFLQTFETKMKNGASPISESSIVTSTGSSDSSTLSAKDDPSGVTISSV